MHRDMSCWQADGMGWIWDAPKSSADATSHDLDTVLFLPTNAGKCMCSQGAPNHPPGHIHRTLQPLQESIGFPLAPGDDEPNSTTPTGAEPGFKSALCVEEPFLEAVECHCPSVQHPKKGADAAQVSVQLSASHALQAGGAGYIGGRQSKAQ